MYPQLSGAMDLRHEADIEQVSISISILQYSSVKHGGGV